MLDLQPIKARRENAGLEYGTFIAAAPDDISALVTEVARLRKAIASHKRRCVIDPQPWDRDLWAVLDA